MALPIEYNVVIEGEWNEIVDWGNAPGWLTDHRVKMDEAQLISLVPKDKSSILPQVTVRFVFGQYHRWVLFSRVYGQATSGREVRLYCIGWQVTVKGINIKALQWIYPDGSVECAEEPSFVHQFLR